MLNEILIDLQGRFGSKVLLEPADLVEVIGISTGQQANLRSQGKFPIPTTKVGNKVKVSIYALAQWLVALATQSATTELATIPNLNRAEKKAIKGHLKGQWWAFRQEEICSIIKSSIMETTPHARSNRSISLVI